MPDLTVHGDPVLSYNADTEETVMHDVTIVTGHMDANGDPAPDHGWTAPQIAQYHAGSLRITCEKCSAALAETP